MPEIIKIKIKSLPGLVVRRVFTVTATKENDGKWILFGIFGAVGVSVNFFPYEGNVTTENIAKHIAPEIMEVLRSEIGHVYPLFCKKVSLVPASTKKKTKVKEKWPMPKIYFCGEAT